MDRATLIATLSELATDGRVGADRPRDRNCFMAFLAYYLGLPNVSDAEVERNLMGVMVEAYETLRKNDDVTIASFREMMEIIVEGELKPVSRTNIRRRSPGVWRLLSGVQQELRHAARVAARPREMVH